MKKGIAIFFLSIYVISLTELHQFIKLPLLIEHYKEHKSKNKDLSLLDFMVLHYAADTSNNADKDQDMKLPFKSHDGCLNSTLEIYTACNASVNIFKPVPVEAEIFLEYRESFISSTFLSSIWQPPKFC